MGLSITSCRYFVILHYHADILAWALHGLCYIVLIIIGYIGYCVVFLRLSSQAGVLASRTDGVRAENALGDGRGRSPKQEKATSTSSRNFPLKEVKYMKSV